LTATPHAAVRELRDLLREDDALRAALLAGLAAVPAVAFEAAPLLAEAGDVGAVREVRGAHQEERPPVGLVAQRIDVRAGPREARAVGLLLARLEEISAGSFAGSPTRGSATGSRAVSQVKVGSFAGAVAQLHEPIGELQQRLVLLEHREDAADVLARLLRAGLAVRGRVLARALELDPVPLAELVAQLPEFLGVEGVR
jgi:hypothetical protein